MKKAIRQIVLTGFDDGSWTIDETVSESTYPETAKKNKREMAQRLLQLLDLGPTAPQIGPEKIEFAEDSHEQE